MIRLSDKKGFTLAELLLAAAILAFVFSGVLLVFINCVFLNEASRNLTVAVSHAEFALEEIKSRDFSNISAGSTTWNSSIIAPKGLIPLGAEILTITVINTDSDDIHSPKDSNVTVNWEDRGIRDRSLTLETLLTEP